MDKRVLLAVVLVAVPVSLAGCISDTDLSLAGLTDVDPTGRTVELKFWVETIQQEIYPGFTAELWAFCAEALPGSEDAVEMRDGQPCSVPGPTIHVTQGDRVVVNFRNPHDFPHTIHWHGQHVPFEMDGVPGSTQDTVEQGQEYTYDYIATRPGTLMYHCHVDTHHHVFMGLYGAFIVEPQNQEFEPEVDKEFTLMLSHGERAHMAVPEPGGDPHAAHRGDFGSGNPGKQNGQFEVDYDVFMINGKSYPNTDHLMVEEGDRVRIRLINIGFLPEAMHLHGHDMLVTHKDGLPLQKGAQFYADTIRLDPGERYDVYVEADNPGNWHFHTHYDNHVTNDRQSPGGMMTHLMYEGFENLTYRGALPGGLPSGGAGHGGGEEPLPEDLRTRVSGEVTDAAYEETHTFPVTDTRAKRVQLDATLTPSVPLPVDEVTIALLDAEGNELSTATLTQDAPTAMLAVTSVSNTGDYTIAVTGQGVEAAYAIDIWVQYQDEHADAGGDEHAHH